MAYQPAFFAGAETGDLSEIPTVVGTWIAATDHTNGGGYSYKHTTVNTTAATLTYLTSLSASTFFARCVVYIHVTTPPSSQCVSPNASGILALKATSNIWVALVYNTDGTIALRLLIGSGAGTQVGSDFPISTDAQVCVELRGVKSATVGIAEVRVNGVVVITDSNLNTGAVSISSIATSASVAVLNGLAASFWIDDIQLNSGAYPNPGKIIARQGIAGTPTYDTWTKNGAATAALCISDTPFNAATNISTLVAISPPKQTVNIGSFSAAGTANQGSLVIGSSDIINVCKVAAIMKRIGTNGSDAAAFIHIIGGVETDVSLATTIGSSDGYFDDSSSPWIATVSQLTNMEAGVSDISGTGNPDSMVAEDLWVMVDYTPTSLVYLKRNERVKIQHRNFVKKNIPTFIDRLERMLNPPRLVLTITDSSSSIDIKTVSINFPSAVSSNDSLSDTKVASPAITGIISSNDSLSDTSNTTSNNSSSRIDQSSSSDTQKLSISISLTKIDVVSIDETKIINVSVTGTRQEIEFISDIYQNGNISKLFSVSDSIISSDVLSSKSNSGKTLSEIITIIESYVTQSSYNEREIDEEITVDDLMVFLNAVYVRSDIITSADLFKHIVSPPITPITKIIPMKIVFSFKESNIIVKESNTQPTIIIVEPEPTIKYKP